MSFLFRKTKKDNLKAVYEDDLVSYLKSINLYDDIIAGNRLCKFCGNKITIESLEVIVPNGGNIEIVCYNNNCINQL